LEAGFRGIDTANQRKHYHEAGVGEAVGDFLKDGNVDRSDLFLQTKFTYQAGQDHRLPYDPEAALPEQVRQSLESSLVHLDTEYVDAFLLHGPSTRNGLAKADREVWQTFEELVNTSAVNRIGVSNVSPDQLETFLDIGEEAVSFVQNRCFARTGWDRSIRKICEEHEITYQGFSLLTANKRELQTEAIREIADRHEKTIPQIIFRFAIQIGMVPLTGTTSQEHMEQDLACRSFDLSEDEISTIEELSVG
jgi:diketogulonate reductase-like aldo/keto reductase